MADNNEEQYNSEENAEFDGAEMYEATEEHMEEAEKLEENNEVTNEEAEEAQYQEEQTETTDESHEQPGNTASRVDDDERKIFVGGLSWETTAKDLKEYFEKFGTVLDCILKTDPNTGRSRGFGFVVFDSASSVDKVIGEKSHVLHNKNIDPKRAMTRGAKGGDACKKVFVGGVSPDMPEAEIREYFGKFGKIEEIELPFDRVKNQRRAYVFISYESEEVVEQVIANPKQKLGGKDVDVRKATPRSEQEGFGGRGGRGGPGQRGRGRGRGGYGQVATGYYPDPVAAAPVAPAYDYSGYYNYGQGYAYGYPGYGYPGYDYSSYYGQADWSNYQQGYAQSYPDTQSGAGKAKRGATGASYHPYSR